MIWFRTVALVMLTAFYSFAAVAQEDNKSEETKQEEPKKKFERVQVTGSLIRRADFEGPSPIQIIDRQALDESALNSVGDYIRELPVSNTGATRESSGRVGADAASVNLRGLGARNTLVLMNNMRLPSDPTVGFFDMNLIPEIAIESTTILKDGASATYGSDAIGGVVNLATRKNFSGTEANVRQLVTEEGGGNRTDLGVIHGREFEGFGPFKRGSITMAAQYRFNQRIWDRDRDWSRPVAADADNRIGWSEIGDVATYIPYDFANPQQFSTDRRYLEAQCSANGYKEFGGGGQGFCGFPFANQSDSLPEIQQLSAYLNSELEISSRSILDITAVATRKTAEWTFAPSPGQPSNGFTIPSSVADTIFQGGTLPGINPGQDVGFFYRTTEFGPRRSEIETSAVTLMSSFKHEFNDTAQWTTSASFTYTDRKDDGISGYALATPFIDAVRNGIYNPFDPNRDPSVLGNVEHQPFQYSWSNNFVLDTNVNGELFSFLGKGLVAGAIGAQYFREEFRDRADPESIPSLKPDGTIRSDVFGSAATSGAGSRDVSAAYGELGITFGPKYEVQLATRYDNYSDFGESLIPKVGFKWRPLDSLMFRASASRAFRAPLLTDLYADASEGNPSYIDFVACDNAGGTPGTPGAPPECLPRQRRNVNSGNENLNEEEADIFGLGFIFEPIRRLSIGVDYWRVDQTNVIAGGTGFVIEQMTRAEVEQGINPNDTPGVQINRSGTGNDEINFTEIGALNLGRSLSEGLDFDVSYSFDTSFGSFNIMNTFAYSIRREVEAFPGVGVQDTVDGPGSPEWRNRFLINFAPVRRHAFSLVFNSIAGQLFNLNNPDAGRTSNFTRVDLSYTGAVKFLDQNGTVTVGVRNLLGDNPPFNADGGATPFDADLYSPLNRNLFVNYRHIF